MHEELLQPGDAPADIRLQRIGVPQGAKCDLSKDEVSMAASVQPRSMHPPRQRRGRIEASL